MKRQMMMMALALTMAVCAQAQEVALSVPFEYEFDSVDNMDGWTLCNGQLTDEGVAFDEDASDWRLREVMFFGGWEVRYMPDEEESFSWLMTPVVDLGNDPTAEVELSSRVMLDEEIDADYFRLHYVIVPADGMPTRADIVATLEADDMPSEIDETVDFKAKFTGYTGRVRIALYAEGEGEWLPWLTIETLGAQLSTPTAIAPAAQCFAPRSYSLSGYGCTGQSRGIVLERRADGSTVKRMSR